MTYKRITPPTVLPITRKDAYGQLRLQAKGSPPTHREDDLIDRLMAAAVTYADGENGVLNRSLITQTWRLVLDEFPVKEIELRYPPHQSVTSITYADAAGNAQTLPPSSYTFDPAGWIVPGEEGWPETQDAINAVVIEFIAGYGDEPDDVPVTIRSGMLLHVEALYDRDPKSQETLLARADDLLENFKAGGGGVG